MLAFSPELDSLSPPSESGTIVAAAIELFRALQSNIDKIRGEIEPLISTELKMPAANSSSRCCAKSLGYNFPRQPR